MENPFVHLHVHSEYSLLDGANKCSDLAATARDMGMNAVALTDHGVMFGCIEFYNKCNEAGIKPIIGCEVYVDPNGHTSREEKKANHLILLAENKEGYYNLVKLVSIANTDGFYFKPRIDHDLLARYSKGLICASACLGGEIPRFIVQDDYEAARERAALYRDIMGEGNFFLEIQPNSIPEQAIVNKALIKMSKEMNIPLIATSDAHYLRREDAEWHDILLCVQTGAKVTDKDRYRFSGDDYYFRSPEEMWGIFGAEAPDSLINTQKIADRCSLDLTREGYFLPEFPLPEGETLSTHLRKQAAEGLRKRLKTENPPEDYVKRLDYELDVIEQMDFPGYFCIVADFITAAKERGIPIGPGRGSAAGSLVAYSLGITDLNPLKYNLLFERFLNPERKSMPDIDTDVSDKGRDELIDYIVGKYGSDKVSLIASFNTMKSKGAIADVGRALDIPLSEVNAIKKLIPDERTGIKNIKQALESVPELKEVYDGKPEIKKMIDYAVHIEGLARNTSQHPAGVVITPRPTSDMVPIRRHPKEENRTVAQYSMSYVEQIGLVKMDLLGLSNLSIIDDALKNIEASGKGKIDLNDVPMDDAKTYEMLQRGDTLGVFQLESSGITALLRRLHPDVFEDIIAVLALYRPGPLESGMAETYVKCKHGEEPVHYLHPKLEPYMKDTYGVILYQEQVMQSAQVLAGYTLGEADNLRRAMGKKKKDVMAKERAKFVEGAAKNGVGEANAGEIFDIIEKFAGYGFNKSHSAAYGLISYYTAWLKANYGAEYLAAYLTSVTGSKMEVMGQKIRSVRDGGYQVLPPDINESREKFTATGGAIRFGLSAIGKVGDAAVANILSCREKDGDFTSFWDFIMRVDKRTVNRGVVENLIKSGSFDGISPNRAQLLAAVPSFLEHASRFAEKTNQASLFGDDDGAFEAPELPVVSDCSEREKLDLEKESMGLYVSGHPFEAFEAAAAPYITCPIADIGGWRSRTPAVTAGVLSSVKEKFSKKSGAAYGVASFEDAIGSVEVMIFGERWSHIKPTLRAGGFYFIKGNPRGEERGTSLLADDVIGEDEYKEKLERRAVITVDMANLSEKFFDGMFQIISRHKGKSEIILKLSDGDETTAALIRRIKTNVTEELKKELADYSNGLVSCV